MRWACLAALLLSLPAAAAEGGGGSRSPCAGKYKDWLTLPDQFLRREQPPKLEGLHLACVWEADGVLQLEAYKDGVATAGLLRRTLTDTAASSWKELRGSLKAELQVRKRVNNWGFFHLRQPMGVFSEDGRRLASTREVLEAGFVLVFEGGQWVWPPVKVGHVRKLPGTDFALETLSVQPVLYRVRGFLHKEECDELVGLGQGRMYTSPVSLMDKDQGKESKEFRTSTQARITSGESKKLQGIEKRVSNLTRIPVTHNEEVQILRYEKTQYYSAHLDNWDPAFYSSPEMTAFMEHGHNNRQITVFWYLTDVESGGETLFPRANGLPQPRDMYSCDQGLKVKPEKGAVILWYSLHPNGNTDPNGLHAACPVQDGQKWSANYWVWNKPRNQAFRGEMPDLGVDEADEEEAYVPQQQQPMSNVVATFENPSSEDAYLFWNGPEKAVFLGVVAAKSAVNMNTYPGHVWHVRSGSDPSSELLDEFQIAGGDAQRYVVGSEVSEL